MPYTNVPAYLDNDTLTLEKLNLMVTALNRIVTPPSMLYVKPVGEAALTTTSATATPIDNTAGKFNQTIVTYGNNVRVDFQGVIFNANVCTAQIGIDVNAVNYPLGLYVFTAGQYYVVSFTRYFAVPAGSNNFKMTWNTNAGTLTLISGYSPMMYSGEI